MKKFLPTSINLSVNKKGFTTFSFHERGFTLIELLVVIAIIAVLSVMGFAVFTGLTNRGNDARRVNDIKAIADAYEVKRTEAMDSYGGLTLSPNNFAGGVVPKDPVEIRAYCIKTGIAAVPNATIEEVNPDITAAGVCGTWLSVNGEPYEIPISQTHFKVCVLLADNDEVRCVGSKQ